MKLNNYNCYWLLGLNYNCDDKEITTAFNHCMMLAQQYNTCDNIHKINMNVILDAYNTLININTRNEYNQYIELKALMVLEQLDTLIPLLISVLNNCERKDYNNVSTSLLVRIKIAMTYINNILTSQHDVAIYLEEFNYAKIRQYKLLKNSYKKQLFTK